jgi:hypothetical protein
MAYPVGGDRYTALLIAPVVLLPEAFRQNGLPVVYGPSIVCGLPMKTRSVSNLLDSSRRSLGIFFRGGLMLSTGACTSSLETVLARIACKCDHS